MFLGMSMQNVKMSTQAVFKKKYSKAFLISTVIICATVVALHEFLAGVTHLFRVGRIACTFALIDIRTAMQIVVEYVALSAVTRIRPNLILAFIDMLA